MQPDGCVIDSQIGCLSTRVEANRRGHFAAGRVDAVLRRHQSQPGVEAGCVRGGEQHIEIGCLARTTNLLGHRPSVSQQTAVGLTPSAAAVAVGVQRL